LVESCERRALLSVTLDGFDFVRIDRTSGADVSVVKVLDAGSNQIQVDLNGDKTTWKRHSFRRRRARHAGR
jgi:hypothetical protein